MYIVDLSGESGLVGETGGGVKAVFWLELSGLVGAESYRVNL
jgi:hypothetical protein